MQAEGLGIDEGIFVVTTAMWVPQTERPKSVMLARPPTIKENSFISSSLGGGLNHETQLTLTSYWLSGGVAY